MNPSLGARARRPWLATVSQIFPEEAAPIASLRSAPAVSESADLSRARALPLQAFTWLAVLLVVALLSGCGFHLQGSGSLPEGARKVYIITADQVTPFAVELRRAIERAGGTMTNTSAEAETVVRIQRDRSGRRVLSVSARNTPQEYEIFYSVEYSVDRGGKEVLETQPLEMLRNLSFDETQLLAKDREEVIVREAMARDLALLVARRLESL
jgi:LPS-assembly lipoprotein